MKAKPVKNILGEGLVQCPIAEATHITLKLPGPTGTLTLPIMTSGTRAGTGNWTWNGDTEKPTMRPSVLVSSGHFASHFKPDSDVCWCKYYEQNPDEQKHFTCFRCHTWITDGSANFLGDCSHDLKNQTIPLLEVEP